MPRLKTLGSIVPTFDTRSARPAEKQADPIYHTAAYEAWRTTVVDRAGGWCQDQRCKTPNRKPRRLFADHVIELQDGGAPFDPANGLARCGSCHTRKTAEERAKRQASQVPTGQRQAAAPADQVGHQDAIDRQHASAARREGTE
jgi:5-methylcytosine-specific restriction protein A